MEPAYKKREFLNVVHKAWSSSSALRNNSQQLLPSWFITLFCFIYWQNNIALQISEQKISSMLICEQSFNQENNTKYSKVQDSQMEEMADFLSFSYSCIENVGESDKTSSLIMLTWDLWKEPLVIFQFFINERSSWGRTRFWENVSVEGISQHVSVTAWSHEMVCK